MKRAPHITNNTFSRRRHHLRTHHCALILSWIKQEVMTTTKHRAYRQGVGNADTVQAQQGLFNQSVRSNQTQAQRANPHNNQPTKAQPRDFPLERFSDAKQRNRVTQTQRKASEKPTSNQTSEATQHLGVADSGV